MPSLTANVPPDRLHVPKTGDAMAETARRIAHRWPRSGGQPLAALGAAARENLEPALGREPGPETRTAFPRQPAWLICPFHQLELLLKIQ